MHNIWLTEFSFIFKWIFWTVNFLKKRAGNQLDVFYNNEIKLLFEFKKISYAHGWGCFITLTCNASMSWVLYMYTNSVVNRNAEKWRILVMMLTFREKLCSFGAIQWVATKICENVLRKFEHFDWNQIEMFSSND